MPFFRLPRKTIQRLGAYPSLILLGVPFAIVEPLKLVILFLAGSGHWITGTFGMIGCYAVSILFVERLFIIVRPKLLTLPWFASVWHAFVSARTRAFNLVRRRPAARRTASQTRRTR